MSAKPEVLREKLKENRPLLFAGVYDALSAKIAERAGFDGLWVSGYAVAASLLGKPDIGLITLTEMSTKLRNICNAVDIPVVCDGEVGYGNAINAMRTVEEFVSAGAAGMQMGDAEYENCPYLGLPTRPVDQETALQKIKAVQATGKDAGFMLFMSQVYALQRATLYASAGADGLLYPWEPVLMGDPDKRWKQNLEEIIDLGVAPVAVLTPFLKPAHKDELWKHGYKIIVLAVENLYASAKVQTDLWSHYMARGSMDGFVDRMYTRQEDFLRLVDDEGMRVKIEEFITGDFTPNIRAKYVEK